MDVSLVMFTQKGERRDFKVREGKGIIGRTKECGIQIGLDVVSRKHCEIQSKDDKVVIRDLGSSNGTYVNNKRIQESELKAGDKVIVGPVIFTLIIDGQPEEVKAVRTVVAGKKKKKESRPPKKSDETGSIDLDASGEMDLLSEDVKDNTGSGPLELEELSEPKGKGD